MARGRVLLAATLAMVLSLSALGLINGTRRVNAQAVCPPDSSGTYPNCTCFDVTGVDRVFFPDDSICINAGDCPAESGFVVIADQCIRGTLPPPDTNTPISLPWDGSTDGRLNPAPDEYYSVYCKNEQIEVWGGVPMPVNVAAVNFDELMSHLTYVPDSAVAWRAPESSVQFNRLNDTITVTGSSGNGPNHPGEKSFSLTACAAALGRGTDGLFEESPQQETETVTSPVTTTASDNPFLAWFQTLAAACVTSMSAVAMTAVGVGPMLRVWRKDGARLAKRLRRK